MSALGAPGFVVGLVLVMGPVAAVGAATQGEVGGSPGVVRILLVRPRSRGWAIISPCCGGALTLSGGGT